MQQLTPISFLCMSLFIFSCKESKNVEPYPFIGKKDFFLKNLNTIQPVDLNFDGIYNTDLVLEIPSIKKNLVIIDFEDKMINIIWEEPQVGNGKIGYLPPTYSKELVQRFLTVQNPYSFTLLTDGRLQPIQALESNDYTFVFPEIVTLTNDKQLIFQAEQRFLTKDGIITIPIKASYTLK
ncbi:hypothetical protein ACR777_01915 [Sphingobacterium spiritivorum]|uniref:hypothetical protein n=1 Tax=Sphingobacterium spiritivorum TaxID=258 RepID=UPI003DA3C131